MRNTSWRTATLLLVVQYATALIRDSLMITHGGVMPSTLGCRCVLLATIILDISKDYRYYTVFGCRLQVLRVGVLKLGL